MRKEEDARRTAQEFARKKDEECKQAKIEVDAIEKKLKEEQD